MKTNFVLTVMFYPENCAFQLTGYDGNQEVQRGDVVSPIPYIGSLLPSILVKPAWGFRQVNGMNGRSDGFLIEHDRYLWRQITLDLQSTYVVDWVDWWPEQSTRIPTEWFMNISLEGETYIRALTMSQFNGGCYAGYVVNAACTMENSQMTLLPIRARFLRICFNEASRINKKAEWAVEVKLAQEDKHQAAPHIQPLPDTTLSVWPSSDSLTLEPPLFTPFVS